MSYGDKRDYPKINIYNSIGYLASTNWAKSCKEAVEKYNEAKGGKIATYAHYDKEHFTSRKG